ncbi:hypothetical protein [Saccharibacillus sp. JS10]|uniref:hypothetical protein n=1 Tax=Saccharibacillus sp. JS10 TaxID=2950552 RepID=UPI00210B32AF|nr:hypothetical protein [Saccharibacillus sp. JS10]MCQ4087492.1 hypothetical protein [Saccharibacillus sp. JS10]
MSKGRREVQQHLPFTAAFALIQTLRDSSSTVESQSSITEPSDPSQSSVMNTLSTESFSNSNPASTPFLQSE